MIRQGITGAGAAGAVQRANALIAVSRYPDAIRELSTALATAPEDFELLCTLALAYLNSGHPKEGLAISRRAVAAAPDHDWPYRLLVLGLRRTGKPKEAVEAATAAMRINPESQLVLMSLAGAQLEAKLTTDALGTANRAVAAGPENPDAYNLRGQVLLQQKRYAEAEADFRYALRLNPSEWAYNNNLGVVLQRQKKHKESVEAFERAVKANPRAKTARQNLFGSATRYVGGGGAVVLVYIALRVGGLIAINGNRTNPMFLAVAGIVVAVAVGLFILQRSRRARLSTTVKTFYASESRRRRGRYFLYVGWRAVPVLVLLVVAFVFIDLDIPFSGAVLFGVVVFAIFWWFFSIFLWRRLVLPRLDAPRAGEL